MGRRRSPLGRLLRQFAFVLCHIALFPVVILLTLCSVYTGLCASLYARLYAGFVLFDYATSCKHNQQINTFGYASFVRFIPMRRMFQVLLYAGFMQHFF